MPKPIKFDIAIDSTKHRLTFKRNGSPIVWEPDTTAQRRYGQAYLSTLTVGDDADSESPLFIFYAEDCHQPTLHAIQAQCWESAYEVFCECEADRGHYLIDDGDPDYGPDDGHWTGDGRRVDSECFKGDAVTLVSIETV